MNTITKFKHPTRYYCEITGRFFDRVPNAKTYAVMDNNGRVQSRACFPTVNNALAELARLDPDGSKDFFVTEV